MHKEILTEEQRKLLPLVSKFSRRFGLVGGTAIALHIGHRESVDFDLFTIKNKSFNNNSIKRKILETNHIDETIVNKLGEFTFVISTVKFTFFHYFFEIDFSEKFDGIIKMPNLLTLAAMKAHALGQRAKWKDYVDLYFIIRDFYSINEIGKKANNLFGNEFNEKMFKVQLGYFKDINYSEKVIYRKEFEVDDETIKKFLVEASLS
ncbi:nucleotidyl transferase AbiEii/AbiGii toxin family protein [bacterium]|nr:nucleotidyl transferase AbiEii/AbiGii toxin family protein [bacterium]